MWYVQDILGIERDISQCYLAVGSEKALRRLALGSWNNLLPACSSVRVTHLPGHLSWGHWSGDLILSLYQKITFVFLWPVG